MNRFVMWKVNSRGYMTKSRDSFKHAKSPRAKCIRSIKYTNYDFIGTDTVVEKVVSKKCDCDFDRSKPLALSQNK